MANESCVHSTVAVELFFNRKNPQRFVDVLAQQSHSPLPPRPKLRRDIVDHRNASLLHLPSYAPVEGWRVDDDGEVRFALVGFFNQMLVEAVDLRQMAEDFRDADNRKIFRVDDGVAADGAHAFSADTEEINPRIAATQGFNELRAVHFSRSFAG